VLLARVGTLYLGDMQVFSQKSANIIQSRTGKKLPTKLTFNTSSPVLAQQAIPFTEHHKRLAGKEENK